MTSGSPQIEVASRAHPNELGVARRLLLSLAATALGWLAAVAVSLVGMSGEPTAWPSAIRAMSFLVGLHVAPAWLFAVLPLAVSESVDSPLLRRGWAALFGAGCGALLLLVALGGFWKLPLHADTWSLFAAAGVCGAVTWETFGLLLRRQSHPTPHPRPADSTP